MVLDDSMLVLGDNMLQVPDEIKSSVVKTHTKPQGSYVVVVYLFKILTKT